MGEQTYPKSTVSKTEGTIEDIVGNALVEAGNISVIYDDQKGEITIGTEGQSQEEVQDTVNSLLSTGNNVSLSYDGEGNTLTIGVSDGPGSGLDADTLQGNGPGAFGSDTIVSQTEPTVETGKFWFESSFFGTENVYTGTSKRWENILSLSPTPNSLAHRWTLDSDDISGDTVIDTIGNVNGTIKGGVTTGVGGKFNEGIRVDGDADGRVDYGNIPALDSAQEFSIAAWVKDVSAANDWDRSSGTIFGDFTSASNNIIMGLHQSGEDFARVERNGTRAVVTRNITFSSSYKLYVMVWDAPTLESYYDGTSLGTASGPSRSIGGTNMYIAWRINRPYSTNLTIDDVRIYDKALSSQEVSNLTNTGRINP